MKCRKLPLFAALILVSLLSCSKQPDINIEDYLPEEVIPPKKVFLKSIIINDLPDTTLISENPWDIDGTGPDIFWKVFDNEGNQYFISDIIWDAEVDAVHVITLDSLLEINNPNLPYEWRLMDWDYILGPTQIVRGRVTFYDGKKTPDIINGGSLAKIEFEMEYEF